MIAIANEKLAETSIANLRFGAGTTADAPPRDGGYDVVLALNLLHLMRLIGKAPKNVRAFDEATLVDAMKRAGFEIEAVERHGATKRDIRCFTVAHRG